MKILDAFVLIGIVAVLIVGLTQYVQGKIVSSGNGSWSKERRAPTANRDLSRENSVSQPHEKSIQAREEVCELTADAKGK